MFKHNEENHESYGQLSFSRVQCTGETLYGSNLKHNTIIKMELKHSSKRRDLSHDWHYGNKTIATVNMSQNQFSELITSMNMGDGIPVTLEYLEEKGRLESPKFASKVEQFEEEFKDTTDRVGEELKELEAMMYNLLSKGGTVKKVDREEMLSKIRDVSQNVNSNMPYVEKRFRETMDKTVTDAKGTIEAFYQHRVTTAGMEALALEDGVTAPKLIEED